MNNVPKPRQRRRMVLTCIECRKRKQKCDRGHPCLQCVARGSESICIYEKYKSPTAGFASTSGSSKASPGSETANRVEQAHDSEALVLLRHAQDYGYSNSDTLGSMAMLSKVIDGIDADISLSHPTVALRNQSGIRAQYYGYVRRLPARRHSELLFKLYFSGVNTLTAALDETMFREQAERWWITASEILLAQGPEGLPPDLLGFPGLMFYVFALALYGITTSYDAQLDELKFAPSQTFAELSREWIECGDALSKLLPGETPTLTTVQQGLVRSQWLINVGQLMQAWSQSGQNVKMAMSIGLHLEPPLPPSSQPEALLDALWMNELKKRTWLNLFVWDQYMAIPLGRPFFVKNPKECTITPPTECDIPTDRLKRVPVARSESEPPSIVTERILRHRLSRRFHEIRELEVDGPIPKNTEKVKDLHHYALDWKKSLPAFFQASNPDTKWDEALPFVPAQREMLSYLFDSFLMALHRPYIFTLEKSKRQVYESALAILDSQDRLFEFFRSSRMQWLIATTFPTFDAAILLAVILVSFPEQYHPIFQRPYQSLKNAFQRLRFMGSTLPLANTGADILQTTMRRVIQAQERAGFTIPSDLTATAPTSSPQVKLHSISSSSSGTSPDHDPWRFEPNQSAMDWTVQDPTFSEFDFSNLDVPIPLKELFWDEELAAQGGIDEFDQPDLWTQAAEQHGWVGAPPAGPDLVMDPGENSLWNFLAGYPTSAIENSNAQ